MASRPFLRERRGSAAVLAFAAILGLALASPLAATGPLVLNAHPWPPFFLGPGAEPPGFAHEILALCLTRAGHATEDDDLNIKRMFEALERGTLDVHVMSRKAERERIVTFGREPLFSAVYRPVIARDRDVRIESLADFDRLRIGHMDGLTYTAEFRDYLDRRIAARDRVDVVAGDEQMERLLQMLVTGRIDVMVNMTTTVLRAARAQGLGERIRILDLELQRSDYFVVASKSSPRIPDPAALVTAVDACVRDLRASGRYAELETKYGFGEAAAPGR